MTTTQTRPRRILIYRESPAFGRMYLCADRTVCSDRSQASEHWESQFAAVVAENWIVNLKDQPAQMEFLD